MIMKTSRERERSMYIMIMPVFSSARFSCLGILGGNGKRYWRQYMSEMGA